MSNETTFHYVMAVSPFLAAVDSQYLAAGGAKAIAVCPVEALALPEGDEYEPYYIKARVRKIEKIERCSTSEKLHINGVCYDSRFDTIVLVLATKKVVAS